MKNRKFWPQLEFTLHSVRWLAISIFRLLPSVQQISTMKSRCRPWIWRCGNTRRQWGTWHRETRRNV